MAQKARGWERERKRTSNKERREYELARGTLSVTLPHAASARMELRVSGMLLPPKAQNTRTM